MVTITSITNNGDGTYDVQFSQPVTCTDNTDYDKCAAAYSPGTNTWNIGNWTTLGTSTTQRWSESNGDDDCTIFVLAVQPQHLTASLSFQVASPVETI